MKRLIVLTGLLLLTLFAAGCSGQKKTVTIHDGRTTTHVTVADGATVGEALAAAEITVNEKDRVTPALDAMPAEAEDITIERCVSVKVCYEDSSKTVEVFGGTVADAVKKSGFTVGENDAVNFDDKVYLADVPEDIVITKRFNITLKADGKETTVLSPKLTVEAFLKQQDCSLDELDRVSPALTETIDQDTTVVVNRVTEKTETKTVSVPYSTQSEYSASMNKGQSQVKRSGVNGSKQVTYKVTYVDGVEESRAVLTEKVLKQPVNAIVVYGTKAVASGGGKKVVSRERVEDCDGSGHGYYIVHYSDGSVGYIDF